MTQIKCLRSDGEILRVTSHHTETFSHSLNIVIRQSWAYSDLMPVVPVIDTGLSPLLQWIVVPFAGFWFARRTLPAAACV